MCGVEAVAGMEARYDSVRMDAWDAAIALYLVVSLNQADSGAWLLET